MNAPIPTPVVPAASRAIPERTTILSRTGWALVIAALIVNCVLVPVAALVLPAGSPFAMSAYGLTLLVKLAMVLWESLEERAKKNAAWRADPAKPVACPACGKFGLEIIDRSARPYAEWYVLTCSSCGLSETLNIPLGPAVPSLD